MLLEKIKDTLEHKEELIHKLKRLRECSEQVLCSLEEKNVNKKRRHRRPAKEIDRHFNCPILKCDKSYGSEGSLNQHIKQKHRKYWNKHCCGKSVKDGTVQEGSVVDSGAKGDHFDDELLGKDNIGVPLLGFNMNSSMTSSVKGGKNESMIEGGTGGKSDKL